LTVKLNAIGCGVAQVDSAPAAIASARDNYPDLLISDFALAGVSGVETAICIRNQVPDCAVLIISGSTSDPQYLIDAVFNIVGNIQNSKGAPLLWLDLNRPARRADLDMSDHKDRSGRVPRFEDERRVA